MDDRTEDTEALDLLLEDADERDLEDLVASLMLEIVRRIGQLIFIRRGLEMVGGLVGRGGVSWCLWRINSGTIAALTHF
jgi:hypothetical protein